MQPNCQTNVHPLLKQLMGEAFAPVHARKQEWSPRVDIVEEEQRFVILADIPGIDPKDIEIELDKDTLIIKGERTSNAVEETAKVSRAERWKGSFVRRFDLPETVDREGISAQGNHGVLEVSLPKRPQPTPRRINVA